MDKLKYTIVIASLLCPIWSMAQINDVVEVENQYVPIIRDANKINLAPKKVEQPVVRHQVDYIKSPLTPQGYVFQPLWAAKSDEIAKSESKGYAHLGYGTYGNLTGRISLGADMGTNARLDFSAGIDGYNGKVKTYDGNNDWTNRFYQSDISVTYRHNLSSTSEFVIDAALEGQAFNYQTMPLINSLHSPSTDKRRHLMSEVTARVTPYRLGQVELGGTLGYKGFKLAHNEWHNAPDAENIFHAGVNVAYIIQDNKKAGLDMGVRHEGYNNDAANFFTFWANPSYSATNDRWNVKIGLLFTATSYLETELHMTPDVTAVYHASDYVDITAKVSGGERSNDFRALNALSPYWLAGPVDMAVGTTITPSIPLLALTKQYAHQVDQLDTRFGIDWKPCNAFTISGAFGLDVQGNRLELISHTEAPARSQPPYLYHHFFTVDGNRFYGELNMLYRYKDVIDVTLNNQINSWESDADFIGPLRPIFDADWKANVTVAPGFVATLDFAIQSYDNNEKAKYIRPNRYDLGAGLSYRLPLEGYNATLFAKANNILNNKYDNYCAYKAPGFNVIAGAAVTF